jgi:hypothetical protein
LAKWGAQTAIDWLKEHKEDWDGALTAWTKVRKTAAQKGTDLHSLLQNYVQQMITDQGGKPCQMNDAKDDDESWKKVQRFAEWATANVEQFIFAEKNTFSKALWVGGQVDCLARMKDGVLAVIDFKSSPTVYFNQLVQTAGYALQLEESGYGEAENRCVNRRSLRSEDPKTRDYHQCRGV